MSKGNGNQKPFEKMIIMKYDCVGIGVVKMTVGVRRRTHEKVQYCITALEILKDAIWHPYDLPQDCTGDVYLTVGLGARALH